MKTNAHRELEPGFRDLRDGWLAGVRLIMALLITTTAALILDCDDQ